MAGSSAVIALIAADLDPDVLDVDQDPGGADLGVLRLDWRIARLGLAGPGGKPVCLAPATAGLPRESPGPAAGPGQTVPGAG